MQSNTTMKVSITDPNGLIVPDTGTFASGGSGHAAILGSGVLVIVFAILGILIAMKKRNKYHFTADGKRKIGLKTTMGLFTILLAGVGIVGAANNANLINQVNNTSAIAPAESLTITAEDVNLALLQKMSI